MSFPHDPSYDELREEFRVQRTGFRCCSIEPCSYLDCTRCFPITAELPDFETDEPPVD